MERNQPDLDRAEHALARQDFDTCIRICDEVLSRDAINVTAHLLRGVASGQVGQFERAIADLGYVLERQPNQSQATFYLGHALRRSGQFTAALPHLRALVDQTAFRARALFEMAICLNRVGQRQQAIGHYRTLLDEQPRHADAAANLANLLERSNQLEEAKGWAERALVLASGNVSAQLTLARVLRRQGELNAAMKLLQPLARQQMSARNRSAVLSQMAQCYERAGRFEDAFHCFTEANATQMAHNPEAAVDDYGSYGIEVAHFLRQWLRDHPAASWSETPAEERQAPVFMLGFPRSGTTLLDQALSAHSQIEVIEEHELLLEVRRKWINPEHFERLPSMTADEVREARQWYRNAQAAARTDAGASLTIDKLPLNSMYIQLIHRLFPGAKFILSLRDPRDVCLSCYFQSFELVGAMPYFLELDSTVRYYDAVMSLVAEAREQLPLDLHVVRYEDLVRDFQGQMRALTRFLGVPWEAGLVDHRHEQAGRDITTPSYQQVAEPLYTRSIGRWKNYRQQLSPVLPRLQPWVEKLGYG
jgi:tetratricopeptide (TPR) repeat protein